MRQPPKAPAGSKKDWETITIEVPPDLHSRFLAVGTLKGFSYKSDAGHEAIREWVERYETRSPLTVSRRGRREDAGRRADDSGTPLAGGAQRDPLPPAA